MAGKEETEITGSVPNFGKNVQKVTAEVNGRMARLSLIAVKVVGSNIFFFPKYISSRYHQEECCQPYRWLATAREYSVRLLLVMATGTGKTSGLQIVCRDLTCSDIKKRTLPCRQKHPTCCAEYPSRTSASARKALCISVDFADKDCDRKMSSMWWTCSVIVRW